MTSSTAAPTTDVLEAVPQSLAQILIVEDEKIIAKDLELRLKRMNYQVVGAVTNSADCMAVLEHKRADLILMDIMIDGPVDGIETAHLVRELYDVPIIFLTAYADESTFQRAKLSDPFGYILKPFQERELDLSIQTVLQKHRLERQIRENEARYRLLFESTQEAIVVLDDEARLVDGNRATELLFARPKEELLGQTLNSLSGYEDHDKFLALWNRHMKDGQGQGRYRLRRPNGEVRYVDYSIQVGFMPQRHLAVLRDVTQKLQDQREIEALARIPDEATNPILRFTAAGELLYANPPADELRLAWHSAGEPNLPPAVRNMIANLTAAHPQADLVTQASGRYYQLRAVFVARAGYVNIYATDITDQHFSEALVGFQRDVLEQVAVGQDVERTLSRVVQGMEGILPDVAALLVWQEPGQGSYCCLDGIDVKSDTLDMLAKRLSAAGTRVEAALKETGPGSVLNEAIRQLKENHFHGRAVQQALYPIPMQERGWLVIFWQAGRSITNRESSVCQLALRLSSTALERNATFQRLYQQSLAFENINDAIILTDPEGVVTEWSPSAERIFHYAKADMVGRRLGDAQLFGPDMTATPSALMRRSNGILTDRQETLFTRPDGQNGWAELSQVDMLDSEGNVMGRLQVARDITQKKHVEQQLDISEQHLKAIFDNAVQSFVLLDLAFKVVAFNGQAERWVKNYGQRRLRKGGSVAQFWPTGDGARLKQCLRQASAGEVAGYEDFLITQNDKSLWFELSLMPVRDAGGHVTGICLTALDIGERKTSEVALARSEARFRSLVQNSSDLVLLLDEEGNIDYASESSARITGYQPEGLQKSKLTGHVHDRDKLRLLDALRRSTDGEEASVQMEYRFMKADGQVLTLESVITNELANPAIRALVVNSRDVTERKMAEDSLRNIVRGVSAYSGEDYFVYLADNLAVHLGIPNVVLAELRDETDLQALALVQSGNPAQAQGLGAVGNFTQDVLHAGFLYVANVQGSQYAADSLLQRFGAEFAVGVALRKSDGGSLGVLIAAGPSESDKMPLAENMLKIFSVRAAMELERIYQTRALLESEANLTALVENTTDAIWSIDPAYRLTALNSSFSDRFGHLFSNSVAAGDSVVELMGPEEASVWRGHYDRALEGLRHTQEIAVLANRTRTEYEVSFNPILSAGFQVTGVSVFARDITERKKAELALRQSEANLSALIENTDDIIYSLDQSFQLVTSNSSFARALYEVGAPTYPREIAEIGPHAFGEAWADQYGRALMGEKFREELPVSLAGEARAIEASFNPILTKDRAVTGVSVMARDVTERKRAEDELKRTNFELDSFVYRASHDLRAPLRSVLGLLNLLKIEKDESQKTTFLGLAEKSINKLDTFISDLTHFSRNTRLEVTASPIDFEAQIAECLENLRFMDKAERVTPIIELVQEGVFHSDPSRIAIIFQNLISNAIKYQRADAESFVRIAITTGPTEGRLVIEDNGKGIAPEYLSRIFEMFFRASEDSYGSGLGLYITQQVVEKLGGKMHVDSTFGAGTKFELVLPNRVPAEE